MFWSMASQVNQTVFVLFQNTTWTDRRFLAAASRLLRAREAIIHRDAGDAVSIASAIGARFLAMRRSRAHQAASLVRLRHNARIWRSGSGATRPHSLKFTARAVPHPTRSTQRLTPGKSGAISPSDTIIFPVNDSSFPLPAR